MAMATAPRVSREILEDRWRTLMRGVQKFAGEDSYSTVNSKRWDRIQNELEGLGAMLVEEADFDNDHGAPSLISLTQGIWTDIERRMLDWADSVEAYRASPEPVR